MQKERELRFPFQITEDGEIELTEEVDREDKNMVSGGLEPSSIRNSSFGDPRD